MHATMCAASLAVFARVLLHNAPACLELFGSAARAGQLPVGDGAPSGGPEAAEQLLLALLDLWLDRCASPACPMRTLICRILHVHDRHAPLGIPMPILMFINLLLVLERKTCQDGAGMHTSEHMQTSLPGGCWPHAN